MLKATSVLSGAKIVTIGITIIRTKVLALLLGPSGMGVVNLINQSLELSRVLFSSGINGATVRRIAEASDLDHAEELNRAYHISVKSALVLGIVSALVFACLSQVLASDFLGDARKFWWFIVASPSLICTPLLAVELAFLQGIKQSRDLALCQVIASVVGSVIILALVFGFGLNGAVLSLTPVVLATALVHRHYVHKHLPKNQRKPIYDFFPEFISLFRMGSAFALNGIWLTAAGMLNIIFLTKHYGPENAPIQIGLNGAATMLASVYVGIIISAMGTEFYPRLINAAGDKEKLNQLINQQTRLAIAIGVPVSTTLILLAPWLLRCLYSAEFLDASEPMRWLIFGMIIRFITCPLGFCVYAACKPRTIAINELLTGGAMIGISYATISIYGLKGVGIGLTAANLVYMIGVAIFLHFNKISWKRRTLVTVLTAILTSVAILAILINSSSLWSLIICVGIITILSALLFNELRKESEISWDMIRRKFLS